MPKIIRNTLLNYIPTYFETEKFINPKRIFDLNFNKIQGGYIVYLCEREIRAKDNPALNFAIQTSEELKLPLKIIHPKINYEYKPKQKFINRQIKQAEDLFQKIGLDFQIINKKPAEIVRELAIAILIVDFNPILNRDYLNNVDFRVYEIDGHNIIPAKFVSDKQEYSAATLRRKIYLNIVPFLTEFEDSIKEDVEADFVLKYFIKNKLPYYADCRNEPSKNVLSGLSKYLNLGFISAQKVALEVIKSDVSDINKENFLEELIIRKELSDNFCLYSKNFKDFSGIPFWAKISLDAHKKDWKSYVYSLEELEQAKTHDKLWNAAQIQLIKEGTIHGYLRMYWAKKIVEWTMSAEIAFEFAIYLNDKYAYDAPSANGYVGILWAIGGLHDRAFIDYPITGKIRRMSYESIRKRCNLNEYIKKYT